MDYLLSIIPIVIVYVMLATSLGLLVGQVGIFSMAQAALFGVGAYADAVVSVKYGWPFPLSFLFGVLLAMVVSALMTIPALRVAGDYFIVASLAMQVIVVDLIENASSYTGGSAGLPGVLRPIIGPFDLFSDANYAVFMALVAAVAVSLVVLAVRSPYGRVLRAVRDDELAAVSLGKSAAKLKLSVSCLAGGIAGAAGVLYAHFLLFISPETFALSTTFTIVAMLIVGGTYSVAGAASGAVVMVMLPELLQRLDLPAESAGPIQQIVFGGLLVLIMFVRPDGLIAPNRARHVVPAGELS